MKNILIQILWFFLCFIITAFLFLTSNGFWKSLEIAFDVTTKIMPINELGL